MTTKTQTKIALFRKLPLHPMIPIHKMKRKMKTREITGTRPGTISLAYSAI
jgi:hypothetical protein